jgi:uncharacterized protein (TIGR02246 family)
MAQHHHRTTNCGLEGGFMKQLVLAFALTICAITASGQTPGAEPLADRLSEAKGAIAKGNSQWSEGWFKRDAKMVSLIFAEDGVQLTLSGKVVKGRQQIMERLKTAMEGVDPGVKVTITTLNVWLDGDTAYEAGKYKYEYVEKGKAAVEEGRYVTAWKKQADGAWKLVMDMPVPPDK